MEEAPVEKPTVIVPVEEPVVAIPIVEEPVVKVLVVGEAIVVVSDMEKQVPAVEVVIDEASTIVDEVSPVDIGDMTHASTEPSLYTDGAYPGGPTDRSVLM